MTLVVGVDGRARCWWAADDGEYAAYHDAEWGRPLRDERGLFERLSLEAFQSGLSWLTILRKRAAFRVAFHDFEPAVVAAFGSGDIARLLGDAAIVRNRAKIEATIANARALLCLHERGDTLTALLWDARPAPRPRPRTVEDIPPHTPESKALARRLKAEGFRFVGPTTLYALMQACGLVDDHVDGCHVPPLPG